MNGQNSRLPIMHSRNFLLLFLHQKHSIKYRTGNSFQKLLLTHILSLTYFASCSLGSVLMLSFYLRLLIPNGLCTACVPTKCMCVAYLTCSPRQTPLAITVQFLSSIIYSKCPSYEVPHCLIFPKPLHHKVPHCYRISAKGIVLNILIFRFLNRRRKG
jgi:hypothetical protein